QVAHECPRSLCGQRDRASSSRKGLDWCRTDSACEGRAIEPRNQASRSESTVRTSGGTASAYRHGLVDWSCRGPRTGRTHTRVPQEPERPAALLRTLSRPAAVPNLNRLAPEAASGLGGAELPPPRRDRRGGPRARRDGVAGVGGTHNTCEAGELSPREAGGGKEGPLTSNRWRATWRGHRAPPPCQRDNNG